MAELQLVPMDNEESKPINYSLIRRDFIINYFDEYAKEMNRKCPESFVKCIGSLKSVFEGIDEDTGEILLCYPTINEWNEELKKFFYRSKENWYRNNNRLTFYTFCKNYGRYDHHIPKAPEPMQYKVKPTVKVSRVYIACSDCGSNHWSDEQCKIQSQDEINNMITESLRTNAKD